MTYKRAVHPVYLLALLCAASMLLTGCRQGSFLGQRYANFTAYYNTFYNAERSFAKGEQSLERTNQAVNRDVYMHVFPVPDGAARSADFENAIRKSADVLRDHAESRWVDDALLLIGKSYFYQQNFVGAEQKFRETIELGSPLEDEARLWLLRTLIAARHYEPAVDVLRESLERDGASRRWVPLIELAGGELHVRRRNWQEAINYLERGLAHVRDRRAAARAQFLLGQVYETIGEYRKAAEAFASVERYRPVYELSYAARYSELRVLGLNGFYNEALPELRRMSRDDKHYANRWELELLRAQILKASGDPRGALAAYDNLLADPEAGRGNLRGRIHYAMGELFRDHYMDYQLASAHFDTASTAIRQNADQRYMPAPSAINDAPETAQVFKTFAEASRRVAHMDSLLHLGTLDEATFDSLIHVYRTRLAEELRAAHDERSRREVEMSFQGQGVVDQAGDYSQLGATAAAAAETQESDFGFLFHKNPARVQEGQFQFARLWGDRPLLPNWRRQEAIGAQQRAVADGRGTAETRTGAVELGAGTGAAGQGAQLPFLDTSGVPRDSIAQAQMRAERASARYEMANVLFLSMDRPDSAAVWYRMVIQEDWDHPVAQRAHYALAELHRSLGDIESSNRLYQEIVNNYPDTDFAQRAREQLGLDPIEQVVVDDAARIAEQRYAEHYALWQNGRYGEALTGMIELARDYLETDVAPRAALAAGLIYTDWARRDTLDIYAEIRLDTLRAFPRTVPNAGVPGDEAGSWLPEPLQVEALYASLETHFPGTPYAERARSLREFLEERRPEPEPEPAEEPHFTLAELNIPRDTLSGGEMPEPVSPEEEAAGLVDEEAGAESTVPPGLTEPRAAGQSPEPGDARPEPAELESEGPEPADTGSADVEPGTGESTPPPAADSAPEIDMEDEAIFSPEDVIESRGGFTWVFSSGKVLEGVQRDVARVKGLGFRAGILEAEIDGEQIYRAAIGQFETRDAALAALPAFAEFVPADVWLLKIQ